MEDRGNLKIVEKVILKVFSFLEKEYFYTPLDTPLQLVPPIPESLCHSYRSKVCHLYRLMLCHSYRSNLCHLYRSYCATKSN